MCAKKHYSLDNLPLISRREFLITVASTMGGVALLGAGVFSYMRWFEPASLQLKELDIFIDHLPEAFSGYKIMHLSDIHYGSTHLMGQMIQARNIAEAMQPDLIAITGDYFYGTGPKEMLNLGEILKLFRAPDGVFTVLGNHDHYINPYAVRRMLIGSGITELRNSVHKITRGGQQLYLCGLDDPLYRCDRMDLVLAQLPQDAVAILLVHEPDYADEYAALNRFQLQLSGHSHGGQVVIPFFGPVILPEKGEKYPAGLYQVGGMQLYTNVGMGYVSPRFRFHCPPEVCILTLHPK